MAVHKKSNLENQQPGYETSDANVRAIAKFGVGLVLIALVAHFLMWLLFDVFRDDAKRQDPELSPLAVRQMQIAPQPRLQADIVGDDRKNQPFDSLNLRNKQAIADDKLLNSYGWVDRNRGIVRIPIDQAMKLLAEQNVHK